MGYLRSNGEAFKRDYGGEKMNTNKTEELMMLLKMKLTAKKHVKNTLMDLLPVQITLKSSLKTQYLIP